MAIPSINSASRPRAARPFTRQLGLVLLLLLLPVSWAHALEGISSSRIGYTYTTCLVLGGGTAGTDTDGDTYKQDCEYKLAYWFEPQLIFARDEKGVGRRPYFAVKRLDYNLVRVAYLLSYYSDHGYPTGWHHGDSEMIYLDIKFNSGDNLWRVQQAYLSAHFGFSLVAYNNLEYANDYRGAPRIWVAKNKHANYATDALCDAGGANGADDCAWGWGEWVGTLADRNVGNSSIPGGIKLIDSAIFNGVTEKYWTNQTFCGWMNPPFRLNCSSAQSTKLSTAGM